MSSFVSKWVVSMQHDVGANDVTAGGALRDDAIERWISEAREAYLDCCVVLRETCGQSGLTLQFRDAELPAGDRFGPADTMVVSAGVTEVYPTAFTIAFRLRAHGHGEHDVAAGATCSVTLVDPATGAACEIGNAVRDEMIALEHGAQHFN